MTPTTGAAPRPAAIAGSGRSRGVGQQRRAPAPLLAAAAACGARVGARADDHRLAAELRCEPAERDRVGRADRPGGDQRARRRRRRRAGPRLGDRVAVDGQLRPAAPARGRPARPRRARPARRAGEPTVPLPGAAAPSLPAGATTSVPSPAAPGDGLRLRRVGEARVGRVDADQRDRHVVGRVAVAVGVDGALEPGEQLVGRPHRLDRAAGRGAQRRDRIGSTRSPAAASTPASASRSSPRRPVPLGSRPGLAPRRGRRRRSPVPPRRRRRHAGVQHGHGRLAGRRRGAAAPCRARAPARSSAG